MELKTNWLLVVYNGNESFPLIIWHATSTQVGEFTDSGGNQDYPQWCFEQLNAVVELPPTFDIFGTTRVQVDSTDHYIQDIIKFDVDYSDYPDGKIVLWDPKKETT